MLAPLCPLPAQHEWNKYERPNPYVNLKQLLAVIGGPLSRYALHKLRSSSCSYHLKSSLRIVGTCMHHGYDLYISEVGPLDYMYWVNSDGIDNGRQLQ